MIKNEIFYLILGDAKNTRNDLCQLNFSGCNVKFYSYQDSTLNTYSQCEIRRDFVTQIVCLPSEFVNVGDSIRLKTENGWEEGWTVEQIDFNQKGIAKNHEFDFLKTSQWRVNLFLLNILT